MRPRLSLVLLLAVAFSLPVGGAEAARFRPLKKSAAAGKQKNRGDGAKRAPGARGGLSGIFRRGGPDKQAKAARQPPGAAQHPTVRQRLARTASKVKRAVTFDRVIRAQIGVMKFGTTMTLGAAIATGRPSVIAMAGVMAAGAYALRPLMVVAERLGERIADRIDRRGS